MMKKFLSFAVIATMMSGLLFSCNNDEEKEPEEKEPEEPEITGPNAIATDNLIAYFAFEGNGKDEISGMTPTNMATTTVTFPDGRSGKGFKGTDDGLNSGLLYALPANSKLRDLKAFSIAFWAKMEPNTLETTDVPEQMVFQIDGTGDWIWGNLFLLQHRNWPEAEEEREQKFAEMDCYFWNDDAAEWKGQRGNGWFLDVTATQWRHIICTYDNVTSKFNAYVNGVHVTRFDGTEYPGVDRKQGEDGDPLGDLKFKEAQNLAIGAWCNRLKGTDLLEDDWAASFKGMIDEFRIYDRGLTATEAKALYDAEVEEVN